MILECSLKYTNVILYADDTTLYISGRNIDEIKHQIENDLNSLRDWFMSNKLSLNLSKMHFMHFSLNNIKQIETLHFGINNINCAHDVNILGIILDDKLHWSKHVEYIHGKISKGICALRTLRNLLPDYVLKSTHYSLVDS